MLGTAAYLSPEQARGEEAGPASDTYSLGVCAYQFLTGRLPHEYSSLTELALKQQQEVVEPITELRPEVPAELDQAIRLCLERDPGSRYRSALEMAEAIEAGLHGHVTDATRRLELSDVDATRALDATSATRAMPRTSYAPVPAYAEPTAPPPRAARRPRRAARRRAGAGWRPSSPSCWCSRRSPPSAWRWSLRATTAAASRPSTRATSSSRSTASAS